MTLRPPAAERVLIPGPAGAIETLVEAPAATLVVTLLLATSWPATS